MSNDRLADLERKRAKIEQDIRREKKRQSEKKRKEDTRRKILVGAVILEASNDDLELRSTLDALLKSRITKKADRELFDLEPVMKNEFADAHK